MNEDRVLFHIADTGDGVQVKFHTETVEDLYSISTVIAQLLLDKPELAIGVTSMVKLMASNKDFRNELEKSTVDMTKFEDILKNE